MKTVVLFFVKGAPTKEIWYYQLQPGRNVGKTTALTDADFGEFVSIQRDRAASDKSWVLTVADVDQRRFDLSPRHPNAETPSELLDPIDLIEELLDLDRRSMEVLLELKAGVE